MINNRQSSNSRRRGRGGSSQGRPSGGGSSSGQRDSGNRIDSRARGNAAQLLEKFKNMARDAQMSGDRVQVEYYLQFADHYFRVLADSRARSDDHRPIRPVDDFDGSDEEYGDEGEPIRTGEQGDHRQPQHSYPQNGRDNQQPRRDDGRRDEARRDDGAREDARRDEPRRDDGRREESRRDEPRRDDSRRDDGRQPRDSQQRDYQSRGDRASREDRPVEPSVPEASGPDYRERVANDLEDAAPVPTDAAVKPTSRRPSRTRGKPAEAEPVETFQADWLPPSLGVTAAPAEEQPTDAAAAVVEGEPKPKRRRRSSSATPGEAQTG